MEFGYESITHKYFTSIMSKATYLMENKYFKVYLQLTIGLILLLLSKHCIPENIINTVDSNEVINIMGDAKLIYKEIKWNKKLTEPIQTNTVKQFQIQKNIDLFQKQREQLNLLYEDMSEIIHSNKLACLSAMYIGLNENIIMLIENSTNLLIFNPEITSVAAENITVEEECIITGKVEKKTRAKSITVNYLSSTDFKYHTNIFKDFSSICLQNHVDLLLKP